MKKTISLLVSIVLILSMVGCNKNKSDLEKVSDYISKKYNYNIEIIEETNFINIKIPTEQAEENIVMIEKADRLQYEIQNTIWKKGYSVAITVSYINNENYVYTSMAPSFYYHIANED